MRPRDWFSVGVRLLGVYAFYHSVGQWLVIIGDRVNSFAKSDLSKEFDKSLLPITPYLVFAIGYLVLSYVLVFGAERLTRWAFNETIVADDPV